MRAERAGLPPGRAPVRSRYQHAARGGGCAPRRERTERPVPTPSGRPEEPETPFAGQSQRNEADFSLVIRGEAPSVHKEIKIKADAA